MKLRDLEQLQSEITILEARLVQLQEPTPATPLEGLPTAEILGEIQKNHRAREGASRGTSEPSTSAANLERAVRGHGEGMRHIEGGTRSQDVFL
jgi:hypothetical protein